MKRSKSIRLILIGSLTAGALGHLAPNEANGAAVSPGDVYTNNHQVPGVGYYHAPFRAWYPHPYNHFDPQQKLYFYGGQWGTSPHQTITNISSPTPQAAQTAEVQRTDKPPPSPVHRSGFGSTSRHHSIWS